jgi:Fic family protein
MAEASISLVTVLELHGGVFKMILPDAGQWRRVNVRIQGAGFAPPRMEKVLVEMENWLKAYTERDMIGEDVFALGAWMHFNFERIHPFSDGNGRAGRLLLNLHLLKRNWPPVHILPTNREDYLGSLNHAADRNFKPLENLLKSLMASSLIDLLDQVGTADDELMSLKEASRLSPYRENYLALRCKQGELPSLKSGREWRTSSRALALYKECIGRKN